MLHAPDVLLLSLSLPGEDGDTGSGDGSGGLILGTEDVAAIDVWWCFFREADQIFSQHVGLEEGSGSKTNEDQVTAAPRAVRVSMRTAVCWQIVWGMLAIQIWLILLLIPCGANRWAEFMQANFEVAYDSHVLRFGRD